MRERWRAYERLALCSADTPRILASFIHDLQERANVLSHDVHIHSASTHCSVSISVNSLIVIIVTLCLSGPSKERKRYTTRRAEQGRRKGLHERNREGNVAKHLSSFSKHRICDSEDESRDSNSRMQSDHQYQSSIRFPSNCVVFPRGLRFVDRYWLP